MLLREIKNIYHKELDEVYPKDEVDSFFYLLIEHYLGLERFVLAVQPDLIISKAEEQPLFEALAALKLHRPVQHIMGKSHFMDMDFKVNEDVLIPRPETEELVRWILEEYQVDPPPVRYGRERQGRAGIRHPMTHNNDQHGTMGKNQHTDSKPPKEPLKILDIGTGSGCIAIAMAKNLPKAKVVGMDISGRALEIARQNAKENNVEIEWIEADILQWKGTGSKFDVIVSNPPYVRQLEKKEMQQNVTDYEPELALFVSDRAPLMFYEAIARFARENLKGTGSLYLEINQYLGKETEQLLKDHKFSEIELRKDMFGNDRMAKGMLR